MAKIKTLVFTTEKNHRWLKDDEAEIVTALSKAKNVEVSSFEYRYVGDITPETYVSQKDGKVRISQTWFDKTFTDPARAGGFNQVAFHFTRDKKTKWGLHSTINGSYFRDTDKVWEFWVCADENQKSSNPQKDRRVKQYARVFIHEASHGWLHWWYPERREDTHTYDYEKSDIKSIFSTITAPTMAVDTTYVDMEGDPVDVGIEFDERYATDNYWEGNDPRAFMLHTTGGHGVIGAVETLIARGLSYNYIIDNGIIYELADWTKSTWHAGVIKQPNMRSQVFFGTLKGAENPNRHSVGVAFTYPAGGNIGTLPDQDVDACVKLMKHVGSKTNVRYNADNIFYHQEVTIDKPIIVKGYREQVLTALVGDKDEKDAKEKKRLMLMIQFLTLKLKYLLLLKGLRK